MGRKSHEEEHENHERWLVSYADFITLLFAFFTVLYATSQQDSEKLKEFEKSIKHYMTTMGFARFNEMSASPGAALPTDEMMDLALPAGAGPGEVQDYLERVLARELTVDQRQKFLAVRHDSVGARMSLAASAVFEKGSAQIQESAIQVLNKIGRLVKASNRRVIIEGHTDNQIISTARFPSNWELAAIRATTMLRYLADVHGIEAQRLVAISYGAEKPIAPNDTEENREKNRRVEILILSGAHGESQESDSSNGL